MDNNNIERRHRNEADDNGQDRFFKIRNILNIIFILGAVVGLLVYFFVAQTPGTIIILAAMAFKIIECALRFMH